MEEEGAENQAGNLLLAELLADHVASIRERFDQLKSTVEKYDRHKLHFSLRKIFASVNLDEKLTFGSKYLPLTVFNRVVEEVNKEQDVFDTYNARCAFLTAIGQILGAEEEGKLEDLVRIEAKYLRKVFREVEKEDGNLPKELKNKRRASHSMVYLGLTTVLDSVINTVGLNRESAPPPRDEESMNLIAKDRSPPPFCQAKDSGYTQRFYTSASDLLAQYKASSTIDPSLQATYKAYLYNPHVTYILAGRTHPLLFREVADAACQPGDGTISEALQISQDLKPGWTSNLAESRLISILDAPCTTPDCRFHGQVMAIAEIAKSQGNEAFKKRQFSLALEYYGRAIGLVHWDWRPNKAIYLSNAAQCLINLSLCQAAIRASTAALEIDPDNYKAWQRRSVSHEVLGNIAAAVGDAQRALSICEGNKVAGSSKVVQDMKGRLSLLRSQIPNNDHTALASFSRSGHDDLALAQGKSLLGALSQQLNAAASGTGSKSQEHCESLSIDLSTALLMYSTILARRAFPGIESNDIVDQTCPTLSTLQYESTITILENISTALHLTPDRTELRVLRVKVAYMIGELDIVQHDILVMKDSSSMRAHTAVSAIEERLEERKKCIQEDLSMTPYCKTAVMEYTNKVAKLHGGKYRHKLRAKKFLKEISRFDDCNAFGGTKQMSHELVDWILIPTFRDAFWSSEQPLKELQARWSLLDAKERRGITSLDDLDAIVERLPAFGDSCYEQRGPYATSQARVDRESFMTHQFIHEAWARVMNEQTSFSYGCALARSISPEIVPRLVPKKACIPLPAASIYGPTLSCGLESFAINDSACAPWRLEMRRKRSILLWADVSLQLLESVSGIATLSLMLRCCQCKQAQRIHAFNRATLQKVHDSGGGITCRDCESGNRHMRGMYHLARIDLHEKALVNAWNVGMSRGPDMIAMREGTFMMCRLDWMTAALDLFEDRLMGKTARPPHGSRQLHDLTSDVLTGGEPEDDIDAVDDAFDNQEDPKKAMFDELRILATRLIASVAASNYRSEEDDTFAKNAKCCGLCGAVVDVPVKCPGCRCMSYCSQQCYYDGWKASHKNCCMPPESVVQILDHLLTNNLSTEEGSFLAGMISSTLSESERHRRKLIKARPDTAKRLSALLQSLEGEKQNSVYLCELATLLNAICSHGAGRYGMGTEGLASLGSCFIDHYPQPTAENAEMLAHYVILSKVLLRFSEQPEMP